MEFDESGEGSDEFEEAVNTKKSSAGHVDYSEYSPEELKELLGAAITDEDYEKASEIRDEINKRKP